MNCLWPRTLIATSAVEFSIPGGKALFARARRPEIVADAVAEILLFAAGRTDRPVLAGRGFPARRAA